MCNDAQMLKETSPGNAATGRESEVPVAEDGEAWGAAEATIRHSLPVDVVVVLLWFDLDCGCDQILSNGKFNLIHLEVVRGLSAVTPIT